MSTRKAAIRPTRRQFLGGAGAVGAAIATAANPANAIAQGSSTATVGDVLLTNGRIHTLDGTNRVVRSALIHGNKIAAVDDRIARPAGARLIDLKGRTVVPGLIEPHVHIVSLANRPGYHTILENTASIKEVQQALAARRKNVPEGQWITSMGGWHPNQWVEHRHPTMKELDEAVPDRPVFLYERFTGPAVVNSMGKKLFDAIDAAAAVHPDVKKVAVSDTGAIAAAGFAGGGPAASALFHLRRMQTDADKRRSTLDAMNYSTALGLTAHLDQVLFPTPGPLHPSQILSNLDQYRMYDSWIQLHREGLATVRMQMNFLHNQADPALPELHERLRNSFQFFGDDMLRTGSIGEWAAPLGAGKAWADAQRLVAQAGWRNENSVQNLAGLRQVVENWEALNKEFPIGDKRWCVHHVPEVTPDLLTRLKNMGCGVQMGAFRWVTSNDPKVVVGPPFRTIVDHGIQVGIHGDGVHIAPLNPWSHIAYAVTGLNSFGQQVNPGQQLTRAEALRLFTRGNAWFLRMEDKIGSLETGKLADVVVLDRDYFTVPDGEISRLRSVLTIVDGRIVHNNGIA